MGSETIVAETLLRRADRVDHRFVNPVPTAIGGWTTARKALPLYFANKEEKTPAHPLGPFHTDTSVYVDPPASGLRVTWLGHSSMLVEIEDVRLLIDPVWDERASPVRWAGPKRFFAPPLKLEELPPINIVLVSHDHYDHLGESTVRTLAKMESMKDTEWVTPLGVGEHLEHYGVKRSRITQLDWTERAGGEKLEIIALPARHFSGRGIFDRFETLWSSFVLKGARQNVYFGADSGWWPGFEEIGAQFGPFDLTMLEIGAYNELWDAIHLGPDKAVLAFEALGGKGLLMPIHWGLFDLALHSWRQPIDRFMELVGEKGIKAWTPEPGRPTEVMKDCELRTNWW
ncbi:MAG: MBL fold metallo-hydrolase [Acidobacteriaceae bacterium]|nr:MBL fold metallo-hydrolase [Acidobacteriaceae bacterium]